MENIHLKKFDIYNIFALNIDCEAVLKSTQIVCFVAKINVNPCKPHFTTQKWDITGYIFHGLHDDLEILLHHGPVVELGNTTASHEFNAKGIT